MALLEVVDDVPSAAAERIAETVRAGGHIVLSGGSTPRRAHELVAVTEGLDWSGVELWFGDDRAVEPEHEHSNFRMAKESLLDRISGAQPTVHRIKGELGADAAADDYEEELGESFGDALPAFDLMLLGLGPDVHTASLFPNDPALDEVERRAVGVAHPGMAPLVPRVTLTLPVLDAAREVVFLVAGDEKAEAARKAFGGGPPGPDAPAGLVRPSHGEPTVLIDAAAARHLR